MFGKDRKNVSPVKQKAMQTFRSQVLSQLAASIIETYSIVNWNESSIDVFYTASKVFDSVYATQLTPITLQECVQTCLEVSLLLHDDHSPEPTHLPAQIFNTLFNSGFQFHVPTDFIDFLALPKAHRNMYLQVAIKVISESTTQYSTCYELSQQIINRVLFRV